MVTQSIAKAKIVLAVAICLALWSAEAAARGPAKRPWQEVPIRIRLAICTPKKPSNTLNQKKIPRYSPVKNLRWIQRHLADANRVLAPHRLRLIPLVDIFVPERCELTTRAHRHAMAHHAPPTGLPTVLVLRRVRDVDVPDYNLMGVHWRYRGKDPRLKGRRYVLLTARAKPPVLAHELCHFFGLPHDPAGGNLMTPGPSSPLWNNDPRPAPFEAKLSRRQAQRLRRGIRAFRQAVE